jgi:hypothetical protein
VFEEPITKSLFGRENTEVVLSCDIGDGNGTSEEDWLYWTRGSDIHGKNFIIKRSLMNTRN